LRHEANAVAEVIEAIAMNETIQILGAARLVIVKLPNDVAKERDELVDGGCCIGCKLPATKTTRGLCNACHSAANRAIRAGKASERELVQAGQLLRKARPGRKPKNEFTKMLSERE